MFPKKTVFGVFFAFCVVPNVWSIDNVASLKSRYELTERLKDVTDYHLRDKEPLKIGEQIAETKKVAAAASASGFDDVVYEAMSVAAVRLVEMRQLNEVENLYQEGLGFKEEDKSTLAKMRFFLAKLKLHFYRDDIEATRRAYENANSFYMLNEFTYFEKIAILSTLANAEYALDDFRSGLARMREVRDIINEKVKNEERRARLNLSASTRIANMYFKLADYQKAIDYYIHGLNDAITLDDNEMIGVFQFNLALSYYSTQNWDGVKRSARISANISEANSDWVGLGHSLEFIAIAQVKTGELDKAIINQKDALKLYQNHELVDYEIVAWANLAYVYSESGLMGKAKDAITRVRGFPKDLQQEVLDSVDFLEANYIVAKNMQNYDSALKFLEEMHKIKIANQIDKEKAQARRLMIEYEVDIAEERSAALEKENAVKTLLLEKKKSEELTYILVTAFVVGVCFLIAIIAVRERLNRRKMHELAMTDALTGAPNRRAIEMMSMKALAQKDRNPQPVALAIVDLDHFKQVNDTYGHDVGDEVLKTFVNTCKPLLREGDTLGRFGGEEFLLLLPNAEPDEVYAVFGRMQEALRSCLIDVEGDPVEMCITMSMGASFEPARRGVRRCNLRERFNNLVKDADEKVYLAKNGGRDRLVMSPMKTLNKFDKAS